MSFDELSLKPFRRSMTSSTHEHVLAAFYLLTVVVINNICLSDLFNVRVCF